MNGGHSYLHAGLALPRKITSKFLGRPREILQKGEVRVEAIRA